MRMMFTFYIFVLLLLSADAEGVWTRYYSANQVTDIVCEGDYVWCATTGGVVKRNRHDGSYIRYTSADGLAGDIVKDIFIDKRGVIWAATNGGLCQFDGQSWRTITGKEGLPLADICCMTQDLDGIMWFGTVRNGVLCFDGTDWKQSTSFDGLGAIGAEDVEVDTNNVKWFATGYSVASFDGKNWKKYSEKDGLPYEAVRDIAVDRNGVKWFATGSILTSYDGVRFMRYQSEFWGGIQSIEIDDNGLIWLATYGGGIGCFDGLEWKRFPEADAVDHLNVHHRIAIDADGNKWVDVGHNNSHDYGVACFDGSSWKRYTVNDGPAANNIMVIGVDAENRKYFGTFFQGLNCFDGKTWSIPLSREESGYAFHAMAFDHDGVMWLSSNGLMSINGSTRKTYQYPDGPLGLVTAIAIGPDNIKWFATSDDGVFSFNGNEWRH
ncbi:MAG: ligand-binding sensor domain-containing protein, partial [Candidatus Latescibacterota bacterium]